MRLNSLVKALLITGFMLAGTTQAAPDAREVLEASPVDDIVAQYPEMMSRGIQDGLKQSGQVPPMVADSIGFLVSNSFRAADIEQRVVANLEAALTPEQPEATKLSRNAVLVKLHLNTSRHYSLRRRYQRASYLRVRIILSAQSQH